jgi:hypothetical protein
VLDGVPFGVGDGPLALTTASSQKLLWTSSPQ